jgi:hypothetical protein
VLKMITSLEADYTSTSLSHTRTEQDKSHSCQAVRRCADEEINQFR